MRRLISISIMSLVVFRVAGQDISDAIKSLQVNSSPAFVILGVEPENIQRPNSPSEFVANVQSATVNNTLATNFAMETTPYWWGRKDADRFDPLDYLTSRGKDDYLKKVLQSVTFSFATSPTDSMVIGSLKPGTGLGLGFRIQLFTGHLSTRVERGLTAWYQLTRATLLFDNLIGELEGDADIGDIEDWADEQIQANPELSRMPESMQELLKERFLKAVPANPTKADIPKIRKGVNSFVAKASKNLVDVNNYQLPLTREGFMLEFAGASARIASNLEWNDMVLAKRAFWLTPSYRFNVNEKQNGIDIIDLMAVARWTSNVDLVDASDYLDAGGKIQYIHERWSVAYEAIYRYATKKPDNVEKAYTYRTGLTFTYKLNDLVTFKVTGGRKFNGNTLEYDEPQRMFIVGGFNFGISKLQERGG